jgi:glycosyltransferase 2 family protein
MHQPHQEIAGSEASTTLHRSRSSTRRIGWYFWNLVLPTVIAVGIGVYFYNKLRSPELWTISFGVQAFWLIPAALLYLCAQTIWGTNSVILLWNQGAHVRWVTGMRAYMISQFGKYAPGKVWVLFLRVGMLGNIGITRTAVGITAMYETLTAMAAGAMIGTLLLHTYVSDQDGLNGFSAYWIAPIALTPIGLVGLNRFVNRVRRWRNGPGAKQYPRVKLHMVLMGLTITSAGWLLLGLSLWLTLRGLGVDSGPLNADSYLHLTSINALAYVIGFVAFFMPAGAGFREVALQRLLAFELRRTMDDSAAERIAAVTAIVLRLAWTVAEMVAAGLLYWFAPPHAPLTRPVLDENPDG